MQLADKLVMQEGVGCSDVLSLNGNDRTPPCPSELSGRESGLQLVVAWYIVLLKNQLPSQAK